MNNLDKQILEIVHGKLQHSTECNEKNVNLEHQFYRVHDHEELMITFKCVISENCCQYSVFSDEYKKIKDYLMNDYTIKYLLKKVSELEEKINSL